ncbi:MAG: hypothetical protein ALECFALPRED_007719 [Alectoria fallacina]|uniref:Major facilitator superfamily (MFS) profile domain-containing protein n=1 Tax=Alectoria fallacina TaxID=1903189 RepID=A0A8H3J0P8_9LECA|nr:MAG: hypothetical protein ALECFALPRED_007719 [Alectoria fallacina]
MADLFREAPFGQLVRILSGNRFFPYPEERKDFHCPHCYHADASLPSEKILEQSSDNETTDVGSTKASRIATIDTRLDLEKSATSSDPDTEDDQEQEPARALGLLRTQTLPYTNERLEIEKKLEVERTKSRPILPARTADGTILVDWYDTDDAANPQNWSQKKKAFVAFQITLYTFSVYLGSAIYTSSELLVMARFGVNGSVASLGLALYVLGYGTGPLIWAPMSEIPAFGRNLPYIVTFAIFVILCVPTALVNNIGGLLFLRFLQGFFGSPCLANGGATMQDMYSLLYLPFSVSVWVSAMFAAPALGPMLSGFAVVAENWRWSLWEILWLAGPVFLLWFFCLPETSASNILLRRSMRLRKLSQNPNISSQSQIDRRGLKASTIAFDAMIKPFEIMFKDPAVLFTNVYTALVYGIYYSFFEVFPLVYPPLYGFNIGETGVVFTCIVVGCVLAMGIYFYYLQYMLIPDILKNGLRAQESRLRPALIFVWGPLIGLFIFGWSANKNVHWIVSVIGITIYALTVYIISQCLFVYIPMSYPQYAASLFAGNDLCRSAFAFAAILFARPMFLKLGIGRGISLLAGLSVLGIIGMWLLYLYGAKLRARSKFAQK